MDPGGTGGYLSCSEIRARSASRADQLVLPWPSSGGEQYPVAWPLAETQGSLYRMIPQLFSHPPETSHQKRWPSKTLIFNFKKLNNEGEIVNHKREKHISYYFT